MKTHKKAQADVFADFWSIYAYLLVLVVFLILFQVASCGNNAKSHAVTAKFSGTVLTYSDLETYLYTPLPNSKIPIDYVRDKYRAAVPTPGVIDPEMQNPNSFSMYAAAKIKYQEYDDVFSFIDADSKFHAYQPLPHYSTLYAPEEIGVIAFNAKTRQGFP